jgi:hypothetical protein
MVGEEEQSGSGEASPTPVFSLYSILPRFRMLRSASYVYFRDPVPLALLPRIASVFSGVTCFVRHPHTHI